MVVTFRKFASIVTSWDKLFHEAADFASQVPRDELISISTQSGCITVWYWAENTDQGERVGDT